MIMSSKELLKEYKKNAMTPFEVEKLEFAGVGEHDVYNITAPFLLNGERLLAGRVEARDSEESNIYFFTKQDGVWVKKEDAITFKMQDPFITFIQNELVIGGVETYPLPENKEALGWRTVFYKGKTLDNLEKIFVGPKGMKDLRLVEQSDGTIGVFTRPQGEKGGRGKIGYACIEDLSDLTIEVIENAPLFEDQFLDEEWGGCNEIHVLKDGTLGVLGHIGSFDEKGNRHYYSMTFQMNPVTRERTKLRLLAIRNNFLEAEAKRSDLVDVVFSGGLVRHSNGTATLYAGIGDACAQSITIVDPFLGL